MKKDTLYLETMPVMAAYLENLRGIIDLGAKYAKTKKMAEKKLIEGRLAPDMFTFIQQIGYAYFVALEVATNLTGREMPTFTYDEKSMRELKTSLKRAATFLKSIKPSEVSKSQGKRMKTFLHPTKKFSREEYVRRFALPNFFFHVTTAYDIFRHLGVPLKKDHYLGL